MSRLLVCSLLVVAIWADLRWSRGLSLGAASLAALAGGALGFLVLETRDRLRTTLRGPSQDRDEEQEEWRVDPGPRDEAAEQ